MWLGMVGDALTYSGFLFGDPTVSPGDNVTVSGDSAAYLYPWYESALVGQFDHSYMREARYAHVSATSCAHNMITPEFKVADEEQVYEYDPPTSDRVASNLLLRDPYEAENVVVRELNIPIVVILLCSIIELF